MVDVKKALKEKFGFEGFREGQEQVMQRLLAGRSVVAVFPTGAGKSLCYQLPALLMEGLTLVVSPLIALMKDQLDFLRTKGIAAARLDSSLSRDELRAVQAGVRSGALQILYVAPERFSNERFVHMMKSQRIAMVAIDEAHCISEWGHNFRPEYMKLARLTRELGAERVLALTATATPAVAEDIARAFAIEAEDVIRTGFHRENLFLEANGCAADERAALLVSRLRERPREPAIVYVTLQRTAEDLASKLAAAGFPARCYHAGLEDDVRHQVQDWFMGSSDAVVVATIAFGMGIDKSDIRAVYHYNQPKSLESYAQEIGRAGRDGGPAHCEMFACPDDVLALDNFAYGDTPDRDALAALLESILAGDEPELALSTYTLSGDHDIRPLVIDTVLTYLELDGILVSKGSFYAEYQVQKGPALVSAVAELGPAAGRVIATGKSGSTWITLGLESARDAAGGHAAFLDLIATLEDRGIAVKPSGARKAYRRLRAVPDADALAAGLHTRFTDREARDVARTAQVAALATASSCLTRALVAHFGESMPECAHCGRCAGRAPRVPPPAPPPTAAALASARALAAALAAEGHRALSTPRQRARFLCGLNSPATSRARLTTRDRRFGALAHWPFARVLGLSGG